MTMLIAMVTTMAIMTMKALMAMMMGMTMKTTGLGFVTGCCLATDADSE